MLVDIHNPTKAPRVIYDGIPASQREIRIPPNGTVKGVEVDQRIVEETTDLDFTESGPLGMEPPLIVDPGVPRPPITIEGMWGIGDNLHQRAVLRELMRTHDVWLMTCHHLLYHDLVAQGLKLIPRHTRLRAQAKTIERERHLFTEVGAPPAGSARRKLWYHGPEVRLHGSILEALFVAAGLRPPARPDFSLPILPEWRDGARKLIKSWCMGGKPLMLYRPIVLRKEWDSQSRNPDPGAYAQLYQHIRERYFVVSIADLAPNLEWIVGEQQQVDVKLHGGELDFQTMAALFAEASLVFCNAGFAPVLAQAVGTPSIVVYGGRESYRTTQRAGAHLAPTLGIDTDVPCDCHTNHHPCQKRISIPPAKARIEAFLEALPAVAGTVTEKRVTEIISPRTLIFGTTWVDCQDRANLTAHWIRLHSHLNPTCDLLLVDSASPFKFDSTGFVKHEPGLRSPRMIHDFGDNVGHLARRGRDGWGRAFTYGLQAAIDGGYDYAFHIEGDSLFRLPVRPIVERMRKERIEVSSTPVRGMIRDMPGWVETGLMCFSVDYLKRTSFIRRYNWQNRRASPTPEIVIRQILAGDLRMMDWKAQRGDKSQITHENVVSLDLDWVTHCHKDAWVYDRFISAALAIPATQNGVHGLGATEVAPAEMPAPAPSRPQETAIDLKLNFGCGTNRLPGWRNMDAEVDITKPLPFADGSASHILAEHCVEHVSHREALAFFAECFRVLAPGGVARIAVPSVEQIMACDDPDYWRFTTKFHDQGPTKRGAMFNILFKHGHQTAWTASLLRASLFYAGFEQLVEHRPGQSHQAELKGVEGHGKVIGERWNEIETCVVEGWKPGASLVVEAPPRIVWRKVAIIVGGAEGVWDEVEQARKLVKEADCEPEFYVINDAIPEIPEPIIAITLHPQKLGGWLTQRKAKGFPDPAEVWSHRMDKLVTHCTADWRGSSGLFAAKVVVTEKKLDRAILCGVPMQKEGKHIVRHQPWGAFVQFRGGWEVRQKTIGPFVRSLSGWTKETLGAPDADWLRG